LDWLAAALLPVGRDWESQAESEVLRTAWQVCELYVKQLYIPGIGFVDRQDLMRGVAMHGRQLASVCLWMS
jgi:hypothetical protein